MTVEKKVVRVRIEGRVQGVWFRAWTHGEAQKRGIRGWVRNRSDGSVEALFAGTREAVDEMLDACWEGPPAANVTLVLPKPDEDPGETGFRQLSTV